MDVSTTPTNGRQGPPSGEQDSSASLVARAYDELRAIAHRRLAARDRNGTFSTTALVHEAYLKLAGDRDAAWQDHEHLLALASVAMRNVLVDRARQRQALKRGGRRHAVTLDDEQLADDDQTEAILQLNDALERLGAWNPRLARVVECRFFGGLTEAETAAALCLTTRTVQRDWVKARVLLRRALEL
jgi:RNA polymerase sigma factor (TIGR02999 family)